MSSGATLNSRLRVLVARAFRAEKLYGTSTPSRVNRGLTFPQIAEAAGELRSKEWQKSYHQLRTVLNDVLSQGQSDVLISGVIAAQTEFRTRTDEAAAFVEQATKDLQEAAARHEFSHLLKLTLELIRQKAIAQSSRAICDELGAVLKASGITSKDRVRRRDQEPAWLSSTNETSPVGGLRAGLEDGPGMEDGRAANVIQFRRQAGAGFGKRNS